MRDAIQFFLDIGRIGLDWVLTAVQIQQPLWAAFLLAMTIFAAANNPAPLTDSMTFSGRWDLRAPDRAITVNTGSYVCVHFTGQSIRGRFDLRVNETERPTIAWRIDRGDWQEDTIWPVVQLATGLSDGPHTAWLMVRGLDANGNRWSPPLVSGLTFLGFDVPGGSFLPPLNEWTHPKLKIEFLGDSITEGVEGQVFLPDKTTMAWKTDALHSYSCQTALALGAMWRQVGFGATGLMHTGGGGAPGALDSFNFFYQGCPRDDWQPDLVVINQGTNDGDMPTVDYAKLYAKYLTLIRQGYPQAKIAALEPFYGSQAAAIKQAVTAAQAAGDKQVYYIDTTGWHSGDIHPNIREAPAIVEKLIPSLKSLLGW